MNHSRNRKPLNTNVTVAANCNGSPACSNHLLMKSLQGCLMPNDFTLQSEKKYICKQDSECKKHLNKPGSYGRILSSLLQILLLLSLLIWGISRQNAAIYFWAQHTCWHHSLVLGILTGNCVPFNSTVNMCEIKGWCPAEIDTIKT